MVMLLNTMYRSFRYHLPQTLLCESGVIITVVVWIGFF